MELKLAFTSFRPPFVLKAVFEVAERTGVYATLRERYKAMLGGRVFCPVTGGAHTSPEVIKFMGELLMDKTSSGEEQSSRVKDSYGSTEFPGISCNGEINAEVDLELVDVAGYTTKDKPHPRGEIRVRHKEGLMATAYWNRPDASAEVFKDGW